MNDIEKLIDNAQREPDGRMWSARWIREHATTYEIKHSERVEIRGAWTFSKACEHPFNTLVTLDFPSTGKLSDVWVVRHSARRTRVYLRHLGIKSHIIWSRHIDPQSNIEQFALLVHIPDGHFDHYAKTVKGWHPAARVEAVDYEKSYSHKGSEIFVIDFLCRAASAESRHKDPSILVEPSAPIVAPRYFHSWKLKKKCRIAHRDAKLAEQS